VLITFVLAQVFSVIVWCWWSIELRTGSLHCKVTDLVHAESPLSEGTDLIGIDLSRF
jgi:hypothetical protein